MGRIDVEELVERAQGGDSEAFGDLASHHWRSLLALARSVLAGVEEAEDMVQESLMIAWRKLPTLREHSAFSAWLRRIVVRRCLRQAAPSVSLEEEAVDEPSSAPREPSDLPRLLATLAPRQRAVVYLSDLEGLTDREIGSLLDIRPATVRVHRLRGRRRLRALLEGGSR